MAITPGLTIVEIQTDAQGGRTKFYSYFDGVAYSLASSTLLDGSLVSNSNPLPISTEGSATFTAVDRSGTVTLGGDAQTIMAANPDRKGALVQNLSKADMYIKTNGDAGPSGNSERVPPGSEWSTGLNGGAVSLWGPETGQPFFAQEES